MNTLILSLLTSNLAIGVAVGALVSWLATKLTAIKDSKFAPFYGIAIQAVKAAEKAIPDDTENKGMAKLDYALKQFITKYEAATGETISGAEMLEVESIVENIVDAVKGEK